MHKASGFDWNKYVKRALDRTEFMALSVSDNNKSWTCPVHFSYDRKCNLYSKSMPKSHHMQCFLKSPAVSAAIFKTERLPGSGGDVIGLQIRGRATILDTREEVDEAAKCHYGRTKTEKDYKTRIDEHLGETAEWKFFKIIPTELWYFDTRFFDEENEGRQKVPLERLDIKAEW